MAYTFKTKRFTVRLTLEPEYADPRDCFDASIADDVVEGINSGRYLWFRAKVAVYCDGREVGADYLGNCCYESADDFRRDAYFCDMVREACREARRSLSNVPRLRAA